MKPSAAKAAPLTGIAKMKAEIAAKKAAEEKAQQDAIEEDRRNRELDRLANQQAKLDAEAEEKEQARLALEKKKEKKQEEATNKLSRLGADVIMPDIEKIRKERAEEEKRLADMKARGELPEKKVKKPEPKVAVVEEESSELDDDWEAEADKLEAVETAEVVKAEAAAALDSRQVHRGRATHKHYDDDQKEKLRSPICCVMGHVDTGKTSLLDRIRRTNVQKGEEGGITQQIGATFFPKENLVAATAELNLKYKYELNLPGLLVIDTPGHESFANLRTRGSSICDVAVLVVDIMHGLEKQTLESIRMLRGQKCPFIIALNKVDRLYGWKPMENKDFATTLASQADHVKQEFRTKMAENRTAFAELGLNCELYYDNSDMKNTISVVPTSAHSGEGISDLLLLMMELVQRFREGKVTYKNELQCTVLEVKPIEGHGTTLDVVLVNGELYEGDTIVVPGLNGPIKTQIRALLTPQPMKESRVKGEFVHHKMIRAAMGVKIAANDLEHAIAGTSLYVLNDDSDYDALVKDMGAEMSSILKDVDKSKPGVIVQSSTLGSLEALLSFLKEMKIPVSSANIGPLQKSHLNHAKAMREKDPKYAVVLAFDVTISEDVKKIADGITIFNAKIIYHLFDKFTEYNENYEKERLEKLRKDAVFPVLLSIKDVVHASDPIIISVKVTKGNLHLGTPLGVLKEGAMRRIGKVVGIQKDAKDQQLGKTHGDYTIKIINESNLGTSFGRHFDKEDELIPIITRPSVEAVKNFKKELDQESINLLAQLIKLQNIPPAPRR